MRQWHFAFSRLPIAIIPRAASPNPVAAKPTMIIALVAACSMSLLFFHVADAAPPTGYARWAVVSSSTLQQKGLADLVTAELSQVPGITLVERDAVSAATNEQTIQALFGADSGAKRRDLGVLLKADALVLLSNEVFDPKSTALTVHVVIADVAKGARLRVETLQFAGGNASDLPAAVRGLLVETRDRYRGGVRSLVAVPDFQSQALSHQYDYLQSGLAALLQNGLLASDGVAVLEIDEARSIAREQELAGGSGPSGLAPLLVEGQYQVKPAPEGPRLDLRLQLTSGGKSQTLEANAIPLDRVADLVGGTWAQQVLHAAAMADQPMTAAQQFDALAARAAGFARVGAWDHSLPLREAALLLRPDAGEQRQFFIDECLASKQLRIDDFVARGAEPDREYIAFAEPRFSQWLRCMEHFEALIRIGQTTFDRSMNDYLRLVEFRKELAVPNAPILIPAEMDQTARRFLLTTYGLMLDLNLDSSHPRTQSQSCYFWEQELFRATAVDASDLRQITRADFDYSLELVEHILPDMDRYPDQMGDPDPAPVGSEVSRFVTFCSLNPWRYDEADYLPFLRRMTASKRPMVVMVGRHGLLWYRSLRSTGGMFPSAAAHVHGPPPELVAEAAALMAEVRRLRLPEDTFRIPDEQLGLASQLTRPPPYVVNTMKEVIVQDVKGLFSWDAVPMTVRRQSGELVPMRYGLFGKHHPGSPLLKMIPCDARFDLAWCGEAVLFHRQKGVLDEVLTDAVADIRDCAWDGRNVWVATARKGIWVLSPDGEILHRIAEKQGLPPADLAVFLHAVSPGKVFATGSFGDHHRGWCALLELPAPAQAAGPKVNVFLEATRVAAQGEDGNLLDPDPHTAFDPTGISEAMVSGKQVGPVLWVRRNPQINVRSGPYLKPTCLQIALSDLSVAVVPAWLTVTPQPSIRDEIAVADGAHVKLPDGSYLWGLDRVVARVKPLGDGKACDARFLFNADVLGLSNPPAIVPYKGALYLPGATWHRVDPKTLAVEMLGTPPVSATTGRVEHNIAGCFVSAQYGLMAYDTRSFYPVTIAPGQGPLVPPPDAVAQAPAAAPHPAAAAHTATRPPVSSLPKDAKSGMVRADMGWMRIEPAEDGRRLVLASRPSPSREEQRLHMLLFRLGRHPELRRSVGISDEQFARMKQAGDALLSAYTIAPADTDRMAALLDVWAAAPTGAAKEGAALDLLWGVADFGRLQWHARRDATGKLRSMFTTKQLNALGWQWVDPFSGNPTTAPAQ